MKRSELEQKLAEHIKGKVLAPPGFSYIALASQLLSICEDSGMMPPLYYPNDAHSIYGPKQNWEPEDV